MGCEIIKINENTWRMEDGSLRKTICIRRRSLCTAPKAVRVR